MVALTVVVLPLVVLALTLATENRKPVPIEAPNADRNGAELANRQYQRAGTEESTENGSADEAGQIARDQGHPGLLQDSGGATAAKVTTPSRELYARPSSVPAATAPAASTPTASASATASVAPATIAAESAATSTSQSTTPASYPSLPDPATPTPTQAPVGGGLDMVTDARPESLTGQADATSAVNVGGNIITPR
jgi:hypothetical protein